MKLTSLAWTMLLALALAACARDQKFSIPVCEAPGSGCGCLLPGWTVCDDLCANLMFDGAHCGGCGQSCDSGQVCVDGACVDDCGGLERCDGACRYDGDPRNCGSCGVVCEWGCAQGACRSGAESEKGGCAAGRIVCDGRCVDPASDPDNCGTCGNVCPNGSCSKGACSPCAGGKELCYGSCVDLRTDRDNCGSCGNWCINDSYHHQFCDQGDCAECDPQEGMAICDGKCFYVNSDDDHCGSSCAVCPSGTSCRNGWCQTSY